MKYVASLTQPQQSRNSGNLCKSTRILEAILYSYIQMIRISTLSLSASLSFSGSQSVKHLVGFFFTHISWIWLPCVQTKSNNGSFQKKQEQQLNNHNYNHDYTFLGKENTIEHNVSWTEQT